MPVYVNRNYLLENDLKPLMTVHIFKKVKKILTKLRGYFPGIRIITSTISKLSILIVR